MKQNIAFEIQNNNLISNIYLLILGTSLLAGSTMFYFKMNTYLSLFILAGFCIAGWLINKAGFSKISALILTISMLITIQYNISSGYGIHDVGIIAWPAFIFFSGLIFSWEMIPIASAAIMISAIFTSLIPNSQYFSTPHDTSDSIIMQLILAAYSIIAMIILRGSQQLVNQLHRSEDRFRTIYNSIQDAVILFEPQSGLIIDFNQMALDMFGYNRKDVMLIDAYSISSGNPPYTKENALAWFKKAVTEGAQRLEWEVKDKNGRLFWVEVNMRLVNIAGENQVLVTVRDISEKKHAEEAQSTAEANYHAIFEKATIGIFQSLPEGTFQNVNPFMARIFGYDSSEDMLECITDIRSQIYVEPESRQEFQNQLAELEEVIEFIGENIKKDGTIIWTSTSARAVKNKEGQIIYYEGFISDITERKLAEEALIESENILRLAQDIAHIGHFKYNPFTSTFECSDELFRIFGLGNNEFLYSEFLNSIFSEDRETVQESFTSAIKNKTGYTLEHRFMPKNGSVKWVRVIGKYITGKHPEDSIFLGTVQDITERKHAEIQQEVIYQVVKAVSNQLDLNLLVRSAAETIGKFTGYPHVSIALPAAGFSQWVLYEAGGQPVENNGLHFRMDQGVIGKVFLTGLPAWIHDVRDYPDYITETTIPSGAELLSEYAAPITKGNKVVGVLNVESDQLNAFDESDAKMIQSLAEMVSLAFDNAKLYGEAMLELQERINAEKTLIESEKRLRQVIDLVPHFIFAKDINGKFIMANTAVANIYGTSVDNLIGKSDAEFDPRLDEVEHFQKQDRLVIESGISKFNQEESITNSFGDKRILSTTKIPFLYSGSKLPSVLGVSVDITDRINAEEALRESEARYRFIAGNTPDVIWVLSLQTGKFTYVSPSVKQLRGYTPEEVLNQTWKETLAPDSAGEFGQLLPNWLETYKKNGHPSVITTDHVGQIRKDGTVVYTEVVTKIVLNTQGEPIEIVGVSRDITERQLAEEDRIAREIAERANKSKNEFLSRMSHELRTPLNAILGFAQLLKMEELNQKQIRGVDQIFKSGHHLLTMVNEVLDISRIESGRLNIAIGPVRVLELINESFDLIQPLAEARNISVTIENPPIPNISVMADRQALKQILVNLFSNAVKYNRVNGEIIVSANLMIDGSIRIQVSDTGDGIPPEKMARLFTPFDRLGMEYIVQEGTGLGLAVSKGLVEAMDGKIGAESKTGVGSIFWIEFKLANVTLVDAIDAEINIHYPGHLNRSLAKILYAEDNLANIKLMEAIMEHLPQIKFISAMQGQNMMDLVKSNKPNLILLDLHQPDLHGQEILGWLNEDENTRKIPVIILSSYTVPENITDYLVNKPHASLSKPIRVKELISLVDKFLGRELAAE